jgi:hypothetical protein
MNNYILITITDRLCTPSSGVKKGEADSPDRRAFFFDGSTGRTFYPDGIKPDTGENGKNTTLN